MLNVQACLHSESISHSPGRSKQGRESPTHSLCGSDGQVEITEQKEKIHKEDDAECDSCLHFHWKNRSPVPSTFSLSSLGLPPRVRKQFIPTWNFHVLQIMWFFFFKYKFSSFPQIHFLALLHSTTSNFLLRILQKTECFLFSDNQTFSR